MSRKRVTQGREHPEARAHAIVEAVVAAWHRAYGAGRLDVPLCMVATVAAAPLRDVRGADTAGMMLTWTAEEFFAYSKTVWKTVVRRRPEAVSLLYPLMAWIFQEPSVELRTQAHEVAMAALRAGEVDLVGGRDRYAVDLLGAVLTVLRPPSAATERGQFYTPPDIADLMVRLSDVEYMGSVEDPAMGTGGMFRAAAVAMREAGRDPRSIGWVGCDIDEMAVACATVNSMIWGLGEDILFYAGDVLLTPDWKSIARARRDELRSLAADIERYQALFGLLEG